MQQQTLKAYRQVPGVARALQAGLEPYLRPEAWDAIRIGKGVTRGVVYSIEGTWFCLVEGSAAQEDLTNARRWRSAENIFVETLIDQLVAIRPRKLVVSVFSRLVRAEEYSGKLLGAARRHVDEVHTGDLPTIVLASEQGATVWQLGTMVSSSERHNQLRRLTLGILISAADGKWVRSIATLPFGYRLRPDKTVEPDSSVKPVVQRMIEILAEPNLRDKEVVDRLAEAGVTSRGLVRRDPSSNGSLDAIRNPASYLHGLRRWLPTYRTGEYVYRQRNPLPGEKQLGGFEVKQDAETGYFEILYRFGLPEGGWGSAALLDAAEATAVVPSRRGGGSHRLVRPLTNVVSYRAGGRIHKLVADRGSYVLRARDDDGADHRPGVNSPFGHGWRFRYHQLGERLASMRVSELHESIANTVMEAIRDGVEAEQLDGWATVRSDGRTRLVDARANRLATLDRQLQDAEARYGAFRRAAAAAISQAPHGAELGCDLLSDAAGALVEIKRLRRHRQAVGAGPPTAHDFGTGFEAEAAFLARALANLADATGLVDAEFARSLAEVVQGLRFEVDGVRVRWSCSVLVPASGGALRLNVGATVPNRVYNVGTTAMNRGEGLLERVLWDGGSLAEMVAFHKVSHAKRWRAQMQQALQSRGLSVSAARVVLNARVPEVGRVIYGHLYGRGIPEGVDPEWAAHIVRVYTAPGFHWSRGWYTDVSARQASIDVVRDFGGCASCELLEGLVPRARMFQFSRFYEPRSGGSGLAPSLQRLGSWDCRRGRNGPRWLSLIPCPHSDCAGTATEALWLPETARGLESAAATMCPDCLRLPVSDSPHFPLGYLRLANNPEIAQLPESLAQIDPGALAETDQAPARADSTGIVTGADHGSVQSVPRGALTE